MQPVHVSVLTQTSFSLHRQAEHNTRLEEEQEGCCKLSSHQNKSLIQSTAMLAHLKSWNVLKGGKV